MSDPKTIAFFPEPGAWGPTNNCVAIANVLAERGHRIVFVVDESFEGELVKRGFEERMMRMAPPEENADPTADPWAEFIRVTAPEFRKPTIEQIETVTKPIWEALGGRRAVLARTDHGDLGRHPARRGVHRQRHRAIPRWSWRARRGSGSSRPTRWRCAMPICRPCSAGCPIDDRSEWQAFKEEYHRQHEALLAEHNDFRASVGVAPCPIDEFNTNSPWCNLYLFPEAADYPRSVPLDPTWHRLNSTVRTTEEPFDVDAMVPGNGKVVYLSLGSLGCMDVGLMQRLIDAMAATEHRTIVSMGPLKDQMSLGPNMYGDQFLPQPSILPQCDLLITHGGNNTVCEGFHFGLPMIGLPLFWDQYDNAQRLRETGFGERLATYDWTDRGAGRPR